jgi:hypothetical protein
MFLGGADRDLLAQADEHISVAFLVGIIFAWIHEFLDPGSSCNTSLLTGVVVLRSGRAPSCHTLAGSYIESCGTRPAILARWDDEKIGSIILYYLYADACLHVEKALSSQWLGTLNCALRAHSRSSQREGGSAC